jgi:hypothetical protein
VILLELWRRRLLARADRDKLRHFVGLARDPLALSRRYPMWRILPWARLVLSPAYARAAARWLEYRMNLYDGVEG